LTACQDDDDIAPPALEVPTSYSFERNGTSTVSFSGQSTRIAMAGELSSALLNPSNSEEKLLNMFRNEGPNGEDVTPFNDAELNAATKSIRSKVAASKDYFSANATDAAAIKNEFDGWIAAQATEVFPRWNQVATEGQAGQIADGSRTRYVNAQGLEYNQIFAKSLLGGLMLDQALNNYLSPAVLDEAQNRSDNESGITATGESYTTMEHKWDEAYGYLFGASADAANPLVTLGEDDKFLNEYLGKVNEDSDFAGIAETIFQAFLRGRAAIVAGDYAERDRQADIIQRELSKVVAVRGAFYLARGADAIETGATRSSGFHALSEAYGFIYSLQFTRNPSTGAPYFSRAEVNQMLDQLSPEQGGLWQVTPETIRSIGQDMAQRLDFSYEAAAN
jgi:hypothetical protein